MKIAEELGMDERTATGWRWVIHELITVAGDVYYQYINGKLNTKNPYI